MKLKSAAIFAVLFLFLTISTLPANSQNMGEYRMKKIVVGEILQENTDILEFFRSLKTKEQDLLNSVLQENYLLGYYTEAVSKDAAFGEKLSKTKSRLQALKEGGLYQAILHEAKNATKTHLLRYIIRRHEAGTIHGGTITASSQPKRHHFFSDGEYWNGLFFGRVYAHISNEYWVPLDPKEVFPKASIKPKPVTAEKMPEGIGSKEKMATTISWNAVGKFSLVGALILLVVTAVVALVGACCCPKLPVFKQVRKMLEY